MNLKKNIVCILILLIIHINGQTGAGKVGINTQFPMQLLHVDALSNNSSFTPLSTETSDDVVITSSGNVGIGVVNPIHKLEIDSGIKDVSGLKLANINHLTPVNSSASYIGVDALGNVVKYKNPSKASFTTLVPINNISSFNFSVRGGDLFNASNTINSSNYTRIAQSEKKILSTNVNEIYFVNYTFSTSIISPSSGGSSFYECRLFVNGQPTTAAQTLREYESAGSFQFALNYLIQPSEIKEYIFDIRIMRVQNSGSEGDTTLVNFTNLSLNGGVSILKIN